MGKLLGLLSGWQGYAAAALVAALAATVATHWVMALELDRQKLSYETKINEANTKANEERDRLTAENKSLSTENTNINARIRDEYEQKFKYRDAQYAKQLADVGSRVIRVRVPVIEYKDRPTGAGATDSNTSSTTSTETAELAPAVSQYILGLLKQGDDAIDERNQLAEIAQANYNTCMRKLTP